MDNKSVLSRCRDLVRLLASVQGDLANITAPPFFLAPSSVVEVAHCWAQRPRAFAAPALEPSPDTRALLVLQLVLKAMYSQFYIGGTPTTSVKKPLNAFLGELFIASWTEHDVLEKSKATTTRLVAEQVSHHPPITALTIQDPDHGIRADGYARIEMTFSGAVDVKEIGHAILHIDRYDEDYLVPLPDMRISGFLSGRIYPEASGTHQIVSSSDYVSELKFTGAGLFSGKRNAFRAKVFHKDAPQTSLYEASGVWSNRWTVTDCRTGAVVEDFVVGAPENAPAPMDERPLAEQDPFESRRAWAPVLDALRRGDYRTASSEKSKIEYAQRAMRAAEAKTGDKWEPLLFRSSSGEDHAVFHRLAGGQVELRADKTKGVWRVDDEKLKELDSRRPFRGTLTPCG